MRMDQIDANFRISRPEDDKYRYVSCREMTVEGFPWMEEDGEFFRLPGRILPEVRPTLAEIAKTNAGGMVRFCTDSAKISVRCSYRVMRNSSGMALAADAGIDLYRKDADSWQFVANYRPEPGETEIRMEATAYPEGMSEYGMYLPLYSAVEELWIGVQKEARIEKAAERKMEDAVLFYGSSVTNGGCASRPGMTYPAIVTRDLQVPMINLGFNGNAHGETVVAEEIAKLSAAMIVIEYDHNAASVEELRATHEPFYRVIREKRPEVPVIFVSRPFFARAQRKRTEEMREAVLETFWKAKNAGERVAYVDGLNLFEGNASDYSVDGIHPNDLGFRKMADEILKLARENGFLR